MVVEVEDVVLELLVVVLRLPVDVVVWITVVTDVVVPGTLSGP